MKWVTRKNANVDRVACPWLIRRFVDPDAGEPGLQLRRRFPGLAAVGVERVTDHKPFR